MTNLDSILESRDITLPTKVCLVKAAVYPVVPYGCESWTIKKAECWRTDAFELWCWRRLLRALWTARRSNQSILKEISPEHSLEGLMLKLKLQYFGHLMQRTDSFEKTLMLGKIEGRREGMTEDDMVGWHHQLPEFTQTHVHQVGDAIQPSHPLSSPSPLAPNPSQHQSFPMSQLFAWGGQSTGVSALTSVLPKNTQDWSPLEWTGWISLQSKGLSRVFFNTTVQKHQFFGTQLSS